MLRQESALVLYRCQSPGFWTANARRKSRNGDAAGEKVFAQKHFTQHTNNPFHGLHTKTGGETGLLCVYTFRKF